MADKVQRILQDVIQDSIYLVKKGVFSEGELKRQMTNRERLENNLVKKSIRTTHYLKAIEYEYQQERIRRYRESEESGVVIDPKYKRANTKDYTILKRAIRLWDRTMHKYRFRIDLWRQYLAFCHVIKSKKAFYKALTNALRFNSFDLSLWLAGAYYQFEVIKNPWKARKIFHKALKLNKSNILFWKQYLRFECEFAEIILKRESALTEETVMKFEGEQVESKLGKIDFKGVLKEVVEAAMEAVEEGKKEELVKELSGVLDGYEQESAFSDLVADVRTVLQSVVQSKVREQDKVKIGLKMNYSQYLEQLHKTFSEKSNEEKLEIVKNIEGSDKRQFLELITLRLLNSQEKITYFTQYAKLMNQMNELNINIVTIALKQLCFSSPNLSSFILSIIALDSILIYKKLINQKINIPAAIITYYLSNYLSLGLSTFEIDETLKRTNKDYKDRQFLKVWVKYNKQNGRYKQNLKLLQTLKISEDQEIFYEVSKVVNQQEEE